MASLASDDTGQEVNVPTVPKPDQIEASRAKKIAQEIQEVLLNAPCVRCGRPMREHKLENMDDLTVYKEGRCVYG